MSVETIARALDGAREEIAIVIGEDELAATVAALSVQTSFRVEEGEAAVLEIEAPDWTTALARAKAWQWLFTLVADP